MDDFDFVEIRRVNKLTYKLMGAMEVAWRQGSRIVRLEPGFFENGGNRETIIKLAPQPFKPISASLYKDSVIRILESDDKLGFVVMDEDMTLYGTLGDRGHTCKVLFKFESNFPDDDYDDVLQLNAYNDYIQRTTELATQFYIDPLTKQTNVAGLVLVGTRHYMGVLCSYRMFDRRLRDKIVNAVAVSCGGLKGFNEVVGEILSFYPSFHPLSSIHAFQGHFNVVGNTDR